MPQSSAYFGEFGGRFVAETLVFALEELERAVQEIVPTESFQNEWRGLLADYVGRPTPLYRAMRLADRLDPEGEALGELWLKREDLCHTGAHKINNALGQVLLAKKLGKQRIIAETGAGQHGVATATACAVFGLPCEVYMGEVDVARQAPNVARMHMLGARVIPVSSGSRTLKDAMNEAMRDWVTNVRTTHYCVGSAAGPHPFPTLVADLQSVIGVEARRQILEKTGALPDAVLACVGGGSNAIGTFRAFFDDPVPLYGIEAAGEGVDTNKHAATITRGRVGVLHGARTLVLTDDDGQIQEAHSISAGLDYPGVGPEHAALHRSGRATYLTATDDEALQITRDVARTEGILIALETAHAFARVLDVARRERQRLGRPVRLLLCLSGRGDKDLATLRERLELSRERRPSRKELRRAQGPKEDGARRLPHRGRTEPRGHAGLRARALEAGADVLELGMPFSDPTADGPVIAAASYRAIQRGGSLKMALACASELRKGSDAPLVLMGYYNPVVAFGETALPEAAAQAGVDGLLIVDLPPEEGAPLRAAAKAAGVAMIPLVAPTARPEREPKLFAEARGFVYYVTVTGVTGAKGAPLGEAGKTARAVGDRAGLPVVAGFGVRTPADASALARTGVDGVVVGTEVVRVMTEAADSQSRARAVRELVGSLRRGLDGG